MKKFFLLAGIAFLLFTPCAEAKIAPYLKLFRGASSAIGSLYFGYNAYHWHKKAEAADPHSAQANYAHARFYVSSLAALILGITAFMAVEKSLEQLDK